MARKTKAGRRDNNTGSIYRDGAGWRVAIPQEPDPLTGKLRFKKARASSHAEAVEMLKQLERAKDSGTLSNSKMMTLGSFLDQWLETIHATRATSTHRQYTWLVNQHIRPALGRKALNKVSRKEVQALLAAKAKQRVSARDGKGENVPEETLSSNTLRLIRAVLHAAYRDAIRDSLVGMNPADFVDLPNVPDRPTTSEKPKFLTSDQAKALLRECTNSEVGDLITFCILTGTRVGEATGVRWQDLNLGEGPQVLIRGQLQRIDGKLTYRPRTKTRSERGIPLVPGLAHRLREIKASRLVDEVNDPDGIVFLTQLGRRIDPKYANDRLKEMCARAEIPEISMHKLRHSCATLLQSLIGDIHTVQKVLGHRQVALTANLYASASAETLRPSLDRLSALLPERA